MEEPDDSDRDLWPESLSRTRGCMVIEPPGRVRVEGVPVKGAPKPWAVRVGDRAVIFCDSRDEAIEVAGGHDDLRGARSVLRLYASIHRHDDVTLATYI